MKKYAKEDVMVFGINEAARRQTTITACRVGAFIFWIPGFISLFFKEFAITIITGLVGYGFWKIGNKLSRRWFK